MKTADQIARGAIEDAIPGAKSVAYSVTPKLADVHRVYYPAGGVHLQILDEDRMAMACTAFLREYKYFLAAQTGIATKTGKETTLSIMHMGLMWLCAIESVATTIYFAAISKPGEAHSDGTPWGWRQAWSVANLYASRHGEGTRGAKRPTKGNKQLIDGWPAMEPLHSGSRRISGWVARTTGSDILVGYEDVLDACDAIRHCLLGLAADED